jgi:sec-independent protein translocase protein TatC
MGKDKKKKKKKPRDPFDTTMSLGDHLEELRYRLIRAILGLVIGTVICLFFGARIIRFIERPYLKVTREYTSKRIEKLGSLGIQKTQLPSIYLSEALFANLLQALGSDPNAPDIDPNAVTFVQGIWTRTLTELANDPNYVKVIADAAYSSSNQLQVLAPADPFVGFIKISLISGLIVSSPVVFYQLWMFIAAGLYEHERRYVRMAVPFSTALFVTGALFFLFMVAEVSLKFFLLFGDLIGVSSNWTFQKYISFVTMLMLIFGVGFQTPVVVFVLNRTGMVSIQALRRSRKFVFLGIFILAAMVTPPDFVSQITLGIPLYLLFELGILLSWLAARRKKKQAEADSA